MKIAGRYTQGDDFVRIYAEDVLYTIDKGTLDYAEWHIGDTLSSGEVLTQEQFDTEKTACTEDGVFVLSDDDDENEEKDEEDF